MQKDKIQINTKTNASNLKIVLNNAWIGNMMIQNIEEHEAIPIVFTLKKNNA